MISVRTRRNIQRAVRRFGQGFGFTLGVLVFAVTMYAILAFPGVAAKRGNDFRELARLPSYGEKR